jgi:hypothetical protein
MYNLSDQDPPSTSSVVFMIAQSLLIAIVVATISFLLYHVERVPTSKRFQLILHSKDFDEEVRYIRAQMVLKRLSAKEKRF